MGITSESYIVTDESGISRRIPYSSVTRIAKVDLNEQRDDSAAALLKKNAMLTTLGRTADDYKETKNGVKK
jgi:hypothetical protein